MKKNKLLQAYVFLLTFVYMYMPNFSYLIGINSYILLIIVFMPAYFIVAQGHTKKNVNNKFKINKTTAISLLLLLTGGLYVLLRGLLSSVNNIEILKNFAQVIMLVFYLVNANIVNKMLQIGGIDSTKQKIDYVLKVGIAQSIIAIIMVIIPDFKQVAINIFNTTYEKENIYIVTSRLYGICDGDYTYGLQITHSILAAIAFMMSIKTKKKKYTIYTILLLSTTILNGRTGILIFIAETIVIILAQIVQKQGIEKAIKKTAPLIVAAVIAIAAIPKILPNTANIFKHMVDDVSSTIDGKDKTETGRWKEMLSLPKDNTIILGRGYRIIGKRGAKYGTKNSSDVGVINDMYLGGLIYIATIYSALIILLISARKSAHNNNLKTIILIVAIAIAMANLKGEALRQPLLLSIMFIWIAIFTSKGNEKKCKQLA